jgi:hypothetical protein
MEFLCHASATDHTASLKNAHTQTRHTEIGRAGQAIVAGTDYDGIEIRHSFAIRVGSESRHNIPFVQVQRGNVGAGGELENYRDLRTAPAKRLVPHCRGDSA